MSNYYMGTLIDEILKAEKNPLDEQCEGTPRNQRKTILIRKDVILCGEIIT